MRFSASSFATAAVCLSVAQASVVGPRVLQAPLRANELAALEDHLSVVPEGFDVNLDELRLVQFTDEAEGVWITEREKFIARAQGWKFFDVTESPRSFVERPSKTFSPPASSSPFLASKITKVIKSLSTDGPRANLEKFTSFRTRYYRSQTGRDSQLWLMGKIQEIVDENALTSSTVITIEEFEHSWLQNTIITKIKGTSGNGTTIIVSAHQDSTNTFPFLPAPGADDDGSGSVTILEAFRGLVAEGFKPEHDVEFHWYSAEEGGLLGSQAVAKDYASKNVDVRAVLHYDMTAWLQKGSKETIALMTDNTNPALTDFLKTLVEKYLAIPWVESTCGYACSDHASWTKAGYPASIGSEAAFELTNHNIHSARDVMTADEFSFDHALHFSKLVVAFVGEVGGWE